MVGWWVVGGRWGSFVSRFDEAPETSSLEARPGNAGVPLMSECYQLARRFVNW